MTRNGWRQELTMRPDQSALSLNVPYSSTTLNRSFGDSTIFHEGDMGSTAELLEVCPRFRILVIGKSGAGKSSLINSAFDVQYANVSHDLPGISDIKQEIISEQNPLFVVHDSQGFAAGETQNFETVKRFIDERAKEPELKDRLHAIWFCMEIPTENGALFQKADENFLKLELHNVPVIIVFTKFDLLISKFEREATDILDENKLDHAVHQRAEKFFQETCVRPLKRIASSHVYVKVSKKQKYHDTLTHLLDETKNRLDENMWALWVMAQHGNVDDETRLKAFKGHRTSAGQQPSVSDGRFRRNVRRLKGVLGALKKPESRS